MNDLMPPPRRRVPDRLGQHLRALLAAHQEETTMTGSTTVRRWAVPALVAAATTAVVIGGSLVVLGDDGSDRGLDPAGGGGSTQPPAASPTPEDPPTTKRTRTVPPAVPTLVTPPVPGQPGVNPGPGKPPTPPATEEDAYERCVDAATKQLRDYTGSPVDGLQGVLAVTEPDVVTVVVSNGEVAAACNVHPDIAVSTPMRVQPAPAADPTTFAFANNDTRNYGLQQGDLSWAGGRLPAGVEEVTYVFPGGPRVEAVTADGYWVVQDLSVPGWTPSNVTNLAPVRVELSGPGGEQVVELPFMASQCNQVSHGC